MKQSPRAWKEHGGIRNQMKNQDHFDHSIVKISENIQKNSQDLKRLAAKAGGKN